MDPINALIGGGLSLISGLFGAKSNEKAAQAATQANIQEQNFMASGGNLPALVQNAKSAGLNPLAVLGSVNPGSPVAVGASPGSDIASAGASAGRILSEMKMPGADAVSKLDQLRGELLQAQIDQTHADTAHTMAVTSHLAVAGQPGRPDGSSRAPYPEFAYYKDPDTGVVTKGLSREFAGTQFGPSAWITGPESLPQLIGGQIKDVGKWAYSHLPSIRPDLIRPYMGEFAGP